MSPLRKQGSRALKLDSRFLGNDKKRLPQQELDSFITQIIENHHKKIPLRIKGKAPG